MMCLPMFSDGQRKVICVMTTSRLGSMSWEDMSRDYMARKKGSTTTTGKSKDSASEVVPVQTQDKMVTQEEHDLVTQLETIINNDPGMHAPVLIHSVLRMVDRVSSAQLRQQTVYLARIQKLEEDMLFLKGILLDMLPAENESDHPSEN